MPASDRLGPPKVPLPCAACVGSLTCRPCTQRAHMSVEERCGVVRQSRGCHLMHARLNTPPRLHQTPLLNPHANRETYSGHTSVHKRAGIKRNIGRDPPIRRLFNLLFKRGQTPAKNRTPPPLPYLLLHHFFTLTMAYEE